MSAYSGYQIPSPQPQSGTPGYYGHPRRVRFEVIGEAWNLLLQQWSVWVPAMLIYLLATFALVGVFFGVFGGLLGAFSAPPGGRSGELGPEFTALMVLFYLVFMPLLMVVSAYFMGGMYRMAAKQVRGQPIAVGDLFGAGDVFLPMTGAALLIGLATTVGALLCYLPGIILAGLFMLAYPLIVDRRIGSTEAMRLSWNALKPDLWMATGFYFVVALLASLGAYVCGVGMLLSFPLLFLATAMVYRDIFDAPAQTGGPQIQMPAPPSPPASPGAFDL